VWCSVVQCGAVWCSVVQCGAVWCSVVQGGTGWCSVVQCGAGWCSVVQFTSATYVHTAKRITGKRPGSMCVYSALSGFYKAHMGSVGV